MRIGCLDMDPRSLKKVERLAIADRWEGETFKRTDELDEKPMSRTRILIYAPEHFIGALWCSALLVAFAV